MTGAFLPRTLSLSCDVEMCLFESEEELLLLQGCVAYARDSEIALCKVCLTGHLKASKEALVMTPGGTDFSFPVLSLLALPMCEGFIQS